MLKAQILKHLFYIPGDRILALHLRDDRKTEKARGLEKHTPSHGLFTHFRRRLREKNNHLVFESLLEELLDSEAVNGGIIAIDSTHVHAYSQFTWHGLEKASIHVSLVFGIVYAACIAAALIGKPELRYSIAYFA